MPIVGPAQPFKARTSVLFVSFLDFYKMGIRGSSGHFAPTPFSGCCASRRRGPTREPATALHRQNTARGC